MRKSLIFLLVALGTLGAYALSGLFPDTAEFPRIPIGTGTIGNILATILGTTNFELSNGRVNNTAAFSWVSGNGYLHIGNCSNASEVWRGVDDSGNPLCGQKKPSLVFGNIESTSGTVTVIRYQDGSNVIASAWLPLYAGDIVVTDPASEAEIGFPSDNSILRLDQNTNVELQYGTLGGNTVAQAIVNDGSLWGRVLTGTGINFGGAWYIAWVRGTSILTKQQPFGGMAEYYIVHSTHPTNAVTYTFVASGTSITGWAAQRIYGLPATNVTDPNYNILGGGPLQLFGVDQFYMMDSWIRDNTKKDIVYLKDLSVSWALSAAEQAIALNELIATTPAQGSNECLNLLTGPVVDGTGNIDWAVQTYTCIHPVTTDTIDCWVQGEIYWPWFQDCKSYALALADYTEGTDKLFFSTGWIANTQQWTSTKLLSSWQWLTDDGNFYGHTCISSTLSGPPAFPFPNPFYQSYDPGYFSQLTSNNWWSSSYSAIYLPTGIWYTTCNNIWWWWDQVKYNSDVYGISLLPDSAPASGILISGTAHISYPLAFFPGGASNLVGKTVSISISGTPISLSTIVDFWFDNLTGKSYRIRRVGGWYQCVWNGSTSCVTVNGSTLSFVVPSYVKYLIFWNNKDTVWALLPFSSPINTTIQKIQIN